jgi:hypothetical protein
MPHLTAPFAAWANFYVIVGSSAGALTGLQFVVIVLGAESNMLTPSATRAFASPTMVHFCVVLLLSATLSAPWRAATGAAACLVAVGIAGLAYLARVLWHMIRQDDYVPVAVDWIWHLVLPFIAYVTLAAAAIALAGGDAAPMFVIAGVALLLLFVGIHNAWDNVTHIALNRNTREP